MAAEELFLGLAQRKLDVEHPAPRQDQREEAQLAPGVAHLHRAPRSPVELGALPGGKLEGHKRRRRPRPHRPDKPLEDRVAALVPVFPKTGQDLDGRVRMGLQEPHDLSLVRIELARPRRPLALLVARPLKPLAHGLRAQPELAGDLPAGEPVALAGLPDCAVGLVVDHGMRFAGSSPRTW